MKNRISISFIILIGFCFTNASARDYWGLRNIDTRAPDSVYVGFDADYYAFAVSWARSEIEDDQFTWEALDNSLDMSERFGGKVVLVVSCDSRWATGGETRAPDDIDRRTPLADDPPQRGYSESLYDFTYNLVDHIAARDELVVRYLRFVNEPEYNWEVDQDYEQDVEDYVRCLRTFYIAAHTAADENDLEILVSHGGFYYVHSLARKYYRLGEENEALQDSLIALLQSRYERHATRINDWEDVTNLVEGRGGMPPNYWTDVMAGQTEWLDWFDVHYHFKPRFIFDELGSFEEVVQDSGGELRPWLAAEAAMQLAEGSLTEYDEYFHAGDMARKWILGMAFGLEGICTPLTGSPPEHFFGLFDDEQQEYMSAQTYRFLRSIIEPVEEPEDRSNGRRKAFRFRENSTSVKVIWLDALSDTDEIETGMIILGSEEFRSTEVYDIEGDLIGNVESDDILELLVTQDPIIIVRHLWEGIGEENAGSVPSGFRLISVYPNPFNSQTIINFSLSQPSSIRLAVYDLSGRVIDVIMEDRLTQGEYQVVWNADGYPAGLYFIRLEKGSNYRICKALLVK